ncbi:hypothetical protein GP486_008401, partial [Trichoglossum hirsutum]
MPVRPCCSVCGKACSSPDNQQQRHSLAPDEAACVCVCTKCKGDRSPISIGDGGGGGEGGGNARGQHVASDSHDVQVRKKRDQIQIRIFSDSERKGRRPANTIVLEHRKSAKRTGSVPARPNVEGYFVPAQDSRPSTSRHRSLSRRRSPSGPVHLPAENMRGPNTGEEGPSPLSATCDHHPAYRPQKAQLHDRDLPSPHYSPVSPEENLGNRYSHYKTDERLQVHNNHPSKVHRRYQSADISGADLQPTSGPAYQARLTLPPDPQRDTQRPRWRRSNSGESTAAVVGSPHVHFGPGVSRQRVEVSNDFDLPQRRRPRVTEEINRLLGPDSDDESKGGGGGGWSGPA